MTNKKSLVLVDDDKDTLRTMTSVLERNSYEVHAFNDPIRALEFLKTVNSPQLLISDIRMPGMNGFELAREVAKSHPEMMIMLVSSFQIDKDEFTKVFPSTRIDACISKPIRLAKLIDAVNALMLTAGKMAVSPE